MSDAASTPQPAFGARMTLCKCGHPAVEHYDSYSVCTWTLAEPPECSCEEFDAAEPERYVQVGVKP